MASFVVCFEITSQNFPSGDVQHIYINGQFEDKFGGYSNVTTCGDCVLDDYEILPQRGNKCMGSN